ncbi:hypothetical protein TNCV_3623611 [Trichonephila clavipes]|nr:hypothetical protein TNCV_3623611 [Trichonephila clavipes]
MAFSDGPLNFEFWPSDEDDTRASTLFPNFLTTPTGGCLSLDRFNEQRPPLPGCYSMAFGDGPLNFEFWPSDEDDTRASTLSPNYHTTPTEGRLSSRQI